MSTYPPLPAAPACWSWDAPSLPQPNYRGVLMRWQDGRCAVCGARRLQHRSVHGRVVGLWEDHDHRTGLTRGYLCPRCNTSEPVSLSPVFAAYRRLPPTAIMGLRIKYGHSGHPDHEVVFRNWQRALETVYALVCEETARQRWVRVEARSGPHRRTAWGRMSRSFPMRTAVSPLVHVAIRYRLLRSGHSEDVALAERLVVVPSYAAVPTQQLMPQVRYGETVEDVDMSNERIYG